MLSNFIRIKVRFSEVDSIKVVWHGNYVAYLEDGREAFGREFGLGYMDMFEAGLTAPIVDVHLRYLKSASVNDHLVLKTTYVEARGAKLIFDYELYRLLNPTISDDEAFEPKDSTHELILTAQTTQLWMRGDEFEVSAPEFFANWKVKYGLRK